MAEYSYETLLVKASEYFKAGEFEDFKIKLTGDHYGMRVGLVAESPDDRTDVIAEIATAKTIPRQLIGWDLGFRSQQTEKVGLLATHQIYFSPSRVVLVVPDYADYGVRWQLIDALREDDRFFNSGAKLVLSCLQDVDTGFEGELVSAMERSGKQSLQDLASQIAALDRDDRKRLLSDLGGARQLCGREGIGLLRINAEEGDGESCCAMLEQPVSRIDLFERVIKNAVPDVGDAVYKEIKNTADHLLLERAAKTLARKPPVVKYLDRHLLESMYDLSKVQYRDVLSEFAHDYPFLEANDYSEVVKVARKLWTEFLGVDDSTAKGLDFFRDFESLLKLDLERKYRDHFLHQFQVFLLGTRIIDDLYDTISEIYSTSLSGKAIDHAVELAWLAASTFHDFAYPVERYSQWDEELFRRLLGAPSPTSLQLERIFVEEGFVEYLDQIASHLDRAADNSCGKWCYGQETMVNEKLRRFLMAKIVRDKNHGVLSAVAWLKKVRSDKHTARNEQFMTWIAAPAATAMALHDMGVWRPLSGKPVPWNESQTCWDSECISLKHTTCLNLKNMPMAFLLAYCDCVQEWGRPGADSSDSGGSQLTDFRAALDGVVCGISLPQERMEDKKREFDMVRSFLKSSDIEFKMVLREQGGEGHLEFPVAK